MSLKGRNLFMQFCFMSVLLGAVSAFAADRVVIIPLNSSAKPTGNALPADVLTGKTFSCAVGNDLTGTRNPVPVAATGQALCYDDATGAEILCTDTGQDGELQKGVTVTPRFTDNGDGTVTDNLTGLVWLQDANCIPAGSTADNIEWQPALNRTAALADGECNLTDGSVAGDWRLPNIRELLSLIDFAQPVTDPLTPAIPSSHPFVNVQVLSTPAGYWTSTTSAMDPLQAWYVSLEIGRTYDDLKIGTARWVWPVRDSN